MKNLYRKFLTFYSARTQREKTILIFGSICTFLIIVYLIVSPVFSKLKKLDEKISMKRSELLEVHELKSTYGASNLSSDTRVLEKDLSLLSFLEGITSKLNITIQSFRPSEVGSSQNLKELTADVKLSGVSLKELTEFLYFLEKDSRYSIWIKKFHAKTTFKDPNKLDIDLTVGAYQSK